MLIVSKSRQNIVKIVVSLFHLLNYLDFACLVGEGNPHFTYRDDFLALILVHVRIGGLSEDYQVMRRVTNKTLLWFPRTMINRIENACKLNYPVGIVLAAAIRGWRKHETSQGLRFPERSPADMNKEAG